MPTTFSLQPNGAITPAGLLTPLNTLTPSGALRITTSVFQAGGVTPSGSLALSQLVALAGALAPTSTLAITPTKLLAGQITPAGTLAFNIAQHLAGVLLPAGALFVGLGQAPCGLTLTELRARLYERLDDDGTRWSPAEVIVALNAALNVWAYLTLCIERTVSFMLTGGQCFHSIAAQVSDFIVPLRLTTASGARIRPATFHELDGLSNTWRATAGTPTRYVQAGYDLIAVTPQYAVDTAVRLTYAAAPTALSGEADTPEIQPEQQEHLCDFAFWWLRLKDGGQEAQAATDYLKRFVEAARKYGEFSRARASAQRYDTAPADISLFDASALNAIVQGRRKRDANSPTGGQR